VDFDPSDMPEERAAAAIAAFERFVAAHPGCVVVASGRPGHRHAFVPAAQIERAELAAVVAAGGDHRTTAIRPPLAPHRLGHPVELLHPTDPRSALEALSGLPVDRILLSRRMRDVLRRGHHAGGYQSPSHARMALAVAAVAAGAGPGWIDAVLRDPRNALGESFLRRDEAWRAAEVERLVRRARARLATPSPDLTQVGAVVASARASSTFTGRGGATDLAVLEGLARRAQRLGHHPVSGSVDEVAIEAGVHRTTARRSLRRLQEQGWLTRAEAPTATLASLWRLTTNAAGVPGVAASVDDVDLGCDAARWGAVGKTRMRLYRELTASATRPEELARRLSVAPGTVRRHLAALRRWGLAEPAAGGWVRAGRALEEVAVAAGTGGRRDEQRRDYEIRRRLRTSAQGPPGG
jgi:DNA-binding MarR family transcriptional regulator